MSDLILRPYQITALDQIRNHYQNGKKKVLLHMATGSGKTVIFSTVMKGVQQKGKKCVLVVRGRELVDNASKRLIRENVDHGVFMASHSGWDLGSSIQVCSIDTITARKKTIDLPKADLVVIDEAHFAVSPSFRWLIDHYKESGAFFLSVTATPHVKTGLRHLADEVVYPITIKELIDQRYLVPPRYFAPPSGINYSGVKIDSKTGDYNPKDLLAAVEKTHVTGDIISHYKKLASNRPALLFAIDVEHSKKMVAALNLSGIRAEHLDANSSDDLRKETMSKLENREIDVISNVGILCTGVDMPYVSAIIMARPTKSYNLYIQQIGRGTRPYQNKKDFLILDHADNIDEHGFIEYEKICNLDGKTFNQKRDPTIRCKMCYHVWSPTEQWQELNPHLLSIGKRGRDFICRGLIIKDGKEDICGHDNTPVSKSSSRDIITCVDSELREVNNAEELKQSRMEKFINRTIETALIRGYNPGWIYHKIKDKYGVELANSKWSKIKRRVFPSGTR